MSEIYSAQIDATGAGYPTILNKGYKGPGGNLAKVTNLNVTHANARLKVWSSMMGGAAAGFAKGSPAAVVIGAGAGFVTGAVDNCTGSQCHVTSYFNDD